MERCSVSYFKEQLSQILCVSFVCVAACLLGWCLGQPQPVQGVTPLIRKWMVPHTWNWSWIYFFVGILDFFKGQGVSVQMEAFP